MGFNYTIDHLAFLEAGFPLMTCADLTERFNAHFGQSLSIGQIKSTLKNHKIISGRKAGKPKGYSFLFSKEQVRYVKANYSRLNALELAAAVNEKFGLQIKPGQIKSFVKNHGIVSGRTGCFEKGNQPWNTGTKGQGICKPNGGCFNKGHVAKNTRPFGSERVCSKDGYIMVKVPGKNPSTGVSCRWRAKHVLTWEEHNGPVPKGMILRFIDGDPKHWNITNLELVSRAEHVRLNQFDVNGQPEEFKETVRLLAKISIKRGEIQRAARLCTKA